MSRRELVIGIDGGGSSTRAWLAEATDQSIDVIGKGNSGAGNPQTNPDAAFGHLHDAVSHAFEQADLPRQTVASACICMAGAGRPESERLVRQWAESVALSRSVVIANDALPILYAANESAVGIALICGTGSLAYGRNRPGRTSRCGGWGPILGDEGSGYWIARRAFQAAVRFGDGRGPETDLLPRLLEHLRLQSPSDLVLVVHSQNFGRPEMAALAPLVFESCRDGDAGAKKIIGDAAGELAMAVRSVVEKLDLSLDGYRLAVAGGVLVNQPSVRQMLMSELADLGCIPASTSVVTQPVLGAVRMAATLKSNDRPDVH